MLRTLDFNTFTAGTVIDDEYEGVTISATGGSAQAMIFDSTNPTGDDDDLASDTLGGVLIISEDGDSTDPNDNAGGGVISFDFDTLVTMKSITFKDIEETSGPGTQVIFYAEDGSVLETHFVEPTEDGGESTVQLFVPGTARVDVVFQGSGAIDNVIFEDPGFTPATADGIVSNGDEGALIDTLYLGDPEGDMIDNGDAVLAGEGPEDDIVDAQGGNDTIQSGLGDDDIYAGAGDDVVAGGAGNDIIHGDSTYGNVGGGDTVRESFEWDLAGVADEGDLRGGFSQDTGNTNVTFTVLGQTANPHTEFSSDDELVFGVDTGGELADPNSSLDSETRGEGQSVNYQLGFSDLVNNVDFRINDIDGDGVVRVLAYGPDGEQIAVNLTGGANLTLLDTDSVAGTDTADSNGGYQDDDAPAYSVVVNIPGPVSRIVIEHSQDGANNSGINITDVFFDATNGAALVPGNDDLSGEDGDDMIFGEGGDDTISGGAGVDTLSGGDDADTFIGGNAGDMVDGGAGGDDNDTLDLSGAGPLRVLTQTDDADGNSTSGTIGFLDADGNVVGDVLTFTEIENLILPDVNDAPIAVDDAATTNEGTAVIVDLIGNDTDPDNTNDELTLLTATVPADQGTLADNGDGTVTFTPAPGFTGDATITYTVADPDGLTDEGQAIVTVTADARDGYVDGTTDGDLIDADYLGDPNGDLIDANDEILTGAGPNDDFVRAGDGDDTVLSGAGDDRVEAGRGDDSVDGGIGNDTLLGDAGNDTILGGAGDDLIDAASGELAPDLGYPFAATDPLGYDPDTDTENDRDSVDGGAGNDTIRTGDDRDTIIGGTGNDVIDAGIDDDIVDGGDDDDRIVGGEGNDSILGGAGNDTIYAGNDPDLGLDILDIPDEPTPGFPLSPDRNPDNGQDTVDGGAGNDVIYGADDDDLLMGGSGDDYLDGQIDDDTLQGGSGEDTLIGGQGDDSLEGGTGEDTLMGGIGNDTLRGNRNDDLLNGGDGDDILDGGGENDTLFGGAGDDDLQGGQGDDLLDGGDGDDNITGGAGMDTFRGGAGSDTMVGGGDQDTFSGVNAGDVIDGSSAGIDMDTLDLRGSAPVGGRLEVTYTSADQEDGFVTYYDEDNNVLPEVLVFEEIEAIIPCFTPGTRIATPSGERRVEELQVGDRVITRDNGIQEIRWVGQRDMSGVELARAVHLKPVLIRQGALGNDLPERDMMVSPNHRILVANDKTALYFEEREVLVAAKHLTGLEGVDIVDVSSTTYIHIMFDQHEVVLSDGAWTESFQPGDMSLAGIGNAQRTEILELFPELATAEGIQGYAAARRSLKKHEAQLLT
ncbi:MAG: Hint domain-containing protein [Sulfitobacter sp.]